MGDPTPELVGLVEGRVSVDESVGGVLELLPAAGDGAGCCGEWGDDGGGAGGGAGIAEGDAGVVVAAEGGAGEGVREEEGAVGSLCAAGYCSCSAGHADTGPGARGARELKCLRSGTCALRDNARGLNPSQPL
jgi:hypothetical protein